jgi:hypothetical protein
MGNTSIIHIGFRGQTWREGFPLLLLELSTDERTMLLVLEHSTSQGSGAKMLPLPLRAGSTKWLLTIIACSHDTLACLLMSLSTAITGRTRTAIYLGFLCLVVGVRPGCWDS